VDAEKKRRGRGFEENPDLGIIKKGAGSYQNQSKTGNKKDMRLFKVGILVDITTRETFRLTTIYWVSFHNALVPDIGKLCPQ
jgi:hypothetical protein